jgi:hypothetical protein
MSFDLRLENGDLVIDSGDIATVSGTEKLLQDLTKIAITQAGANPLQPWYGSFISRTLIGSPLPTNITVQMAQTQLQTAIENLMNLQKAQIKSFQPVSPEELIASIVDISVDRNILNPTEFDVSIKVLSKSFRLVSTSFTVSTI